MTLVESLQDWKDAVQFYNQGDFQKSLEKFSKMVDPSAKIIFNLGRVYLSLCELQKSLQAFQLVIKKDEHLAVGHFMLGVVNLLCSRHSDALINFNETFRNLRGSKVIDYKQLGMRYKLYKCEVLLNRAVCLSSLGYNDSATEDLLAALQCKVEPRHTIIDVSLENLQNGLGIEFLVMDAIFQPPKSKTDNLEKRDYLGKAQVVVDTYETMTSPLLVKKETTSSSTTSDSAGETYRVLYDFNGQIASEMSVKAGDIVTVTEKANDGWFTIILGKKSGLVPGSYLQKVNADKVKDDRPKSSVQILTERQALLRDLRKTESRHSLRRVPPPINKPLPRFPTGGKAQKADEDIPTGYVKAVRPPSSIRTDNITASSGVNSPSVISPKLPPPLLPKFPRQRSQENLAGASPRGSPPTREKKVPVRVGSESSDSDDNGYEEIDDMVDPYAIKELPRRSDTTIVNGTKPKKPPALKTGGVTLRPQSANPPPVAPPRPSRANTVSVHGSAFDQKRPPTSPTQTHIPKPRRVPPTLPASPLRSRSKPADKSRSISLEFIVSTSLTVNPATAPEDIKSCAKGLMTGNLSNHLWCKKDGKKVRLEDQNAASILDLVKDGKLKVWCTP